MVKTENSENSDACGLTANLDSFTGMNRPSEWCPTVSDVVKTAPKLRGKKLICEILPRVCSSCTDIESNVSLDFTCATKAG